LLPGDRVGPLCIERLLGAGSMGEVYLARDTRLERLVALKMMVDSEAGERMLREARAASGLRHPGIVTVYDIGEHDGQTYIAMEYVEGETFEALVARRGPLPAAEAVELMAQVGDALATAHEAGILHRDIKSANLMLDERGRARVLDFGLCKLTQASDPGSPAELGPDEAAPAPASPRAPASPPTVQGKPRPSEPRLIAAGSPGEPQTEAGTRMGTPGWAPPELMEGRPADARSDVYSLGVVLYHLLTGHPRIAGRCTGGTRPPGARAPVRRRAPGAHRT
jgi:serine/threonine-protein kinase